MSNGLKGIVAALIATIVLSAVMILNNTTGFMPQANIIGLLTSLGTLTVPSAWMDHFIVGVVVWGMLFPAFAAVMTIPTWLKGIFFGAFAWLVMLVTFLPLAGAGFFGVKIGAPPVIALLVLHLIYGAVLGVSYELLGFYVPIKIPVILPKEEQSLLIAPNASTMNSADINDHLESTSPSGRTVLMIVGGLAAFIALLIIAMRMRSIVGL